MTTTPSETVGGLPPAEPLDAGSSPSYGAPSRRSVWLLVALLVASSALRLWYGLQASQFWDEEFTLANARQVLATGELKPVTGYYPLLSYLPAAGLAAATEWAHGALGLAGEPPRILLVARVVQAAYGTLVLLVLFALGRRIFGEPAALLAVAATGFAAFDILAWGYFKPDALLALATLLSLLLAHAACRGPSAVRYAAAGLGIALSMSSKIIGGIAAVSLAIATAAIPLPFRRRIALLAVAAVSTAAGFLLFNPDWRTNLEYLSIVRSLYDRKDSGSGRTEGLRTLLFDFLPDLAGPAVALFFVAGCIWLGVRLARGGRSADRTAGDWIVLSFPVAYTLAYFATTPHFQGNNFSPLAPLVFLIAAAAAIAAWEAVRRRWRAPAAGALGWLLALGLCATWMAGGFSHVYRKLVPETDVLALRAIEKSFAAGDAETPRLVYAETIDHALPYWQFRSDLTHPKWAVAEVGDLNSVPVEERDLADAQVSVLRGPLPEPSGAPEAGIAELRIRPGEIRRAAIVPSPFVGRGPTLLLRVKGWELTGSPEILQRIDGPREMTALVRLPDDLPDGSLISFAVWASFADLDKAGVPALELGGRTLALHWSGRDDRGHLFVSPRLFRPPDTRSAALRAPGGPIRDAEIELCRWRQTPAEPGNLSRPPP